MTRTWERTLELASVKRAFQLGWKRDIRNIHAHRHFYFDGPVKFQVSWHERRVHGKCEACLFPSFTVDHEGTTYEPKAIEWLELAVTP